MAKTIANIISDYQLFYYPIKKECLKQCGLNSNNEVAGVRPYCNSQKWGYKKPVTPMVLSTLTYQQYNQHQWSLHMLKRLSPIRQRLISNFKNTTFHNFEELINYVEQILKSYPSTNNSLNYGLTIYDIALRIGYNMNPQVLPQKYVYLFAGAYDGACNLYGKSVIKANMKSHKVATSFFAKEFSGCDALMIEDILCIFKTDFYVGMH